MKSSFTRLFTSSEDDNVCVVDIDTPIMLSEHISTRTGAVQGSSTPVMTEANKTFPLTNRYV